MPDGLITMRYDNCSGIDIKMKYSEDKIMIANKTLMRIFNLNKFSKYPGMASLTVEEINFVTYYSGEKTDYFFILMLNNLENSENSEEFLTEISQVILKNLYKNKYLKLIPSLYKQILKNPKKRKIGRD
ncbi:MAG: hypothetical protein ACFFCY_16430 [Promethearchaeota archaeon]